MSVATTDRTNIPDTLLKVVRYKKGDTFQNPVDSFSKSSGSYSTSNFTVVFDTTNTGSYDYDLLCTFYPSGKTFRVTGITHENDRSSVPGLRCVNPARYAVNGQAATEQGYLGMQGFILNVTYN